MPLVALKTHFRHVRPCDCVIHRTRICNLIAIIKLCSLQLRILHEAASRQRRIHFTVLYVLDINNITSRFIRIELLAAFERGIRACLKRVAILLALKRRHIASMNHLDRFLVRELTKVIWKSKFDQRWMLF